MKKIFGAQEKALKDLENAKRSLKVGLYDQAVEAADKAVETILRGWLEQAGVAGRVQPKEQPVVIAKLERMGHAVPLEVDIRRVRMLRNKIRHKGYPAGRRDAETAIGVVEKFISKARGIETEISRPVKKKPKMKKRLTKKARIRPGTTPELAKRIQEQKRIEKLYKESGLKLYSPAEVAKSGIEYGVSAQARGLVETKHGRFGREKYVGAVDYCPEHPVDEKHRIRPLKREFKTNYEAHEFVVTEISKIDKPKRRGKSTAGERKPRSPLKASERVPRIHITRAGHRMFWESVLVLGGLGLLFGGFLLAYVYVGLPPSAGNVGSVIVIIAVGLILTIIGFRSAKEEVRVGGGNAFGAAGMGLLIFSFLRAYELMGQIPELANVLWLVIMVAVGAFLTVMGVPTMHELRVNGRKAWGSAFAAAGLSALVLSVLTIHSQIQRVPQLANVVWPSITAFLGAFLALKGFPLVLEPKDSIRMAWESTFMAAGIGTLISSISPALALQTGTVELVHAIAWIIMLWAIGGFLAIKGHRLLK